MNGGLDKVSYIIKRQGLGLVIIIVHFKNAGMKFVVNQHKYITYRSKGEDLTVIPLHACNYMHFCGQPSYVNRSQRLCNIIFWCCTGLFNQTCVDDVNV